MSRLVARAETWERAYEAFQNINFAAFDYDTVKRSLIDYIKLYFPETFNDFIESSEFVAVIEVFAYIAEIMAYRLDVNAHENFISTAQRKDSILRLAKLVSYSASRPLPSRGLVKLQSVSTTESVVDTNGLDLAGRTIRWNDVSNASWKDQFILVMNRVMEQQFGSVGPTDRFQIQDVLFELYSWNLVPLATGVFPFNANVSGQSLPMELVSTAYDTSNGIIERRPQNNSNFTFLYGQDGLGDASATTGFFCYAKQGQLQRFRTTFDGVTPNQTYDIGAQNVNETDIWLNNVDPTTGATLDQPSVLPYRNSKLGKSGEWVQVDVAHSQNVIFNTNPRRNKYEVETRDENRARLIFGDGEFADIPSGAFDIWARTSVDQDIVIPQSAVSNQTSSFTYVDSFGRTQTFTFTYSLVNTLQNGSAAEDIEHIRNVAPGTYSTQDRMVNGPDYNTYPLQDPSIMKLRAINRTFAGESKYITWHDSSGTYENVKIFSDDGVLYFKQRQDVTTTPVVDTNVLISSYIQPLLSTPELYMNIISAGVPIGNYRRQFNTDEIDRITTEITTNMAPVMILMYYNTATFEWYAIKNSDDPAVKFTGWPNNYITTPLISIEQTSIFETSYYVTRNTKEFMMYSETTEFWNTNDGQTVIDYDTLNSDSDKIVVLQANTNYNRNAILTSNVEFNVVSLGTVESGTDVGLPDTSNVIIVPTDTNGDGVPDNLSIETWNNPQGIADIVKPKIIADVSAGNQSAFDPLSAGIEITLPVYYVVDPSLVTSTAIGNTVYKTNDVEVYAPAPDYGSLMKQAGDSSSPNWSDWATITNDGSYVSNKIRVLNNRTNTSLGSSVNVLTELVKVKEYVYFTRETKLDPWVLSPTTPQTLASFVTDVNSFLVPDPSSSSGYRPLTIAEADAGTNTDYENARTIKRYEGRGGLNFAWFHFSPRYYLVDPSPTNIIDMYVITKGYYISLKRWLEDPLAAAPSLPTPLDLRTSYNYMLDNKMISDTVILHPGKVKLLFGTKAAAPLQMTFKVVRSQGSTMTDNQIKTQIVSTIRNFFDMSYWEFGETFYFVEMATAIMDTLQGQLSSIVPVPTYANNQFGDGFQVFAREDEILYPDITVDNIEIVESYTTTNLRMNG